MQCPNCKTKWDREEISSQLEDYYEKDDLFYLSKALRDQIYLKEGEEYTDSAIITCPECERDFEISMTFKKVKQEIEEVK